MEGQPGEPETAIVSLPGIELEMGMGRGRDGTDSGRTMARSFSLALNDLFKIDGSLADLDAAVDQK
jgi:hypothetical protein